MTCYSYCNRWRSSKFSKVTSSREKSGERVQKERGKGRELCTGRERNHPDIEELLVRHSPDEVLPPVVSAAGAPRVVLLLEQRRSSLLPHRRRPASSLLAPSMLRTAIGGPNARDESRGRATNVASPLGQKNRIKEGKKTNPSSAGRCQSNWTVPSATEIGKDASFCSALMVGAIIGQCERRVPSLRRPRR